MKRINKIVSGLVVAGMMTSMLVGCTDENNNKDTLYFNDVSYGDVVTVEGNDGRKYKYVCWMASPSEGEVQINKGAVGQWTIAGWTRVDR